jgi:V/A-type H+-transporting ATPase subunit I
MNWFPERMTEVEIDVPDRFARNITEMLANEGFLQMEDISYLNTEAGISRSVDWQAKVNEFSVLERQLSATMESLKIDPGAPPAANIKMLSDPEQLKPYADQMEQEVQQSLEILTEAQKNIEQLQNYIDLLSPLVDLDLPIDRIRHRRYIYSVLGSMPTEKIDRFKTSMAKVPFALIVLKKERDQSIVLLVGTRQNKDYLRRAARSAYLSGIDIPDKYQGTPLEIIATLNTEIDQLREQVLTTTQQVDKIRTSRAHHLQDLYWHLRHSRLMAEALTHYGKTHRGYLIAGWLPKNQLEDLENALRDISPEILIEIKENDSEKENRQAPVVLKKQVFLRGFQKLVTTYGFPANDELDPTLLLIITFPLIFGAMFGDVGHGVILALAGLMLLGDKIKKLHRFASLGSVIFLCGVISVVFGFLYGTFFGMENVLTALWQHPMSNIMNLLIVTFAGGALLLSIANILALINDFHQRRWAHFFFSSKGLAGLILYWSLLGLVVGLMISKFPIPSKVFIITAILGVVMIFMSGYFERLMANHKPYMEGGVFVYIIQSFFELFESLISYLSNSLSYVRVGAFAVAHAGLSSVFFILAELISPTKGFGYWLVVILGNIFVIGFEGMIVSIQTLRLEYYEFFSKFFSGGGKRFMPFRLSNPNSQGGK